MLLRHPAPLIVSVLLSLAGCAPSMIGSKAVAQIPGADEEAFEVPVTDALGAPQQLQARLCRPAGSNLARLVVIAHGSPPSASDRPKMQLGRCNQESTRWFTAQGYAVAFALRRGYGATGGAWAETFGDCANADYVRAGRETARDMDATVRAATALPGVRPDGVIVVGQSAGGWGAIAYDSQPHAQVSAFVVMAGGRGGHEDGLGNHNCHPDRLAAAAGEFGATATTPMLWVYAANDTFFAPWIAAALHDAFTQAGGKAELEQPDPYGRDGHRLFFGPGGSAIWGPTVQRYLEMIEAK